jgi:hypothetical protein
MEVSKNGVLILDRECHVEKLVNYYFDERARNVF